MNMPFDVDAVAIELINRGITLKEIYRSNSPEVEDDEIVLDEDGEGVHLQVGETYLGLTIPLGNGIFWMSKPSQSLDEIMELLRRKPWKVRH